MDKTEFMEGIHILQDNYNKKFTKEQLQLYYENLKDLNKNQFIKKIKQAIKINPFVPNIAQIRNEQNKSFANYKQRDYSNEDLNKYYANKRG